jgi:hypothetical protein
MRILRSRHCASMRGKVSGAPEACDCARKRHHMNP